MILSAQSIALRCTFDGGMIEPFVERGVQNGKSYGLSSCGYDIRIGKIKSHIEDPDHLYLSVSRPFVLASSVERFKIPKDICGIVHDKSSWAREGLAVQNTVLEPGWEGYLTLELSLHGTNPIRINKGDPIAQIIFHKLDEETILPYVGKYQNQPNRPVESIHETETFVKEAIEETTGFKL